MRSSFTLVAVFLPAVLGYALLSTKEAKNPWFGMLRNMCNFSLEPKERYFAASRFWRKADPDMDEEQRLFSLKMAILFTMDMKDEFHDAYGDNAGIALAEYMFYTWGKHMKATEARKVLDRFYGQEKEQNQDDEY